MMPVHVFYMGFNDKLGQNNIQEFLPALQTMGFHRKMMQQFMASDYLTKQILNWHLKTNDSLIAKRVGKLENELYLNHNNSSDNMFNKLLFDDGSSNYNAWLRRTTTLDDIRHQLNLAGKELKGSSNAVHRKKVSPIERSALETSTEDEECDDGDITGYAYDGSRHEPNYFNLYPQTFSLAPRHVLKNPHFGENSEQISKVGYETGYGDYESHHPPPEHSSAVSQPPKSIKEISLKDITDIALTTLAFLSFGMFILQVLMCITMTKDESSNLMMLPMEATEAIDTNDGTEEIRRRKRSVLKKPSNLHGINQLSHIILTKIDNLYLNDKKSSSTKFEDQQLCKYSSILGISTFKKTNIWATLYSLGSSWLAARVSNDYLSMIKRLPHVFEFCS